MSDTEAPGGAPTEMDEMQVEEMDEMQVEEMAPRETDTFFCETNALRRWTEQAIEAIVTHADGLAMQPLAEVCASVEEWFFQERGPEVAKQDREHWEQVVVQCALARVAHFKGLPPAVGAAGACALPYKKRTRVPHSGTAHTAPPPVLRKETTPKLTRGQAGKTSVPHATPSALAQEMLAIGQALHWQDASEVLVQQTVADAHGLYRAASGGLQAVVAQWGKPTTDLCGIPLTSKGRLQMYLAGGGPASPGRLRDLLGVCMLLNFRKLHASLLAADRMGGQWPGAVSDEPFLRADDVLLVDEAVTKVAYGERVCGVMGKCWMRSVCDNGMQHTHASQAGAQLQVGSVAELCLLSHVLQIPCSCFSQGASGVTLLTFHPQDAPNGRVTTVDDFTRGFEPTRGHLIMTVQQRVPGSYNAYSYVTVAQPGSGERVRRSKAFDSSHEAEVIRDDSDDECAARPAKGRPPPDQRKLPQRWWLLKSVFATGPQEKELRVPPTNLWDELHPVHDVGQLNRNPGAKFAEGIMRLVMEGLRWRLQALGLEHRVCVLPAELIQTWEAPLAGGEPREIWWERNREHFGENRRQGHGNDVTGTDIGPVDLFKYEYWVACGCQQNIKHWCPMIVCNPSLLGATLAPDEERRLKIVHLDCLGLHASTLGLARSLGSWMCMQHNYARSDMPHMAYVGEGFEEWFNSVTVIPPVKTQTVTDNCGPLTACMLHRFLDVVHAQTLRRDPGATPWQGEATDASLAVGDGRPLTGAAIVHASEATKDLCGVLFRVKVLKSMKHGCTPACAVGKLLGWVKIN